MSDNQHSALTTRLSILSFLQFFVWGAWYTSVAVYMTTANMAEVTYWVFTAQPIGALVSPFFLGLIADRYFATEKVLGILHFISGGMLILAPQFEGAPALFIGTMIAHQLAYTPTLGLSNSLTFRHIPNPERDFPKIRVWGAASWVVAGLLISFVLSPLAPGGRAEATPWPLYLAGIAGIILGFYSFSLPHTPPPAAGQRITARAIIGVDAFKAMASPSFYAFMISSLLLCIPLAAYYNYAQVYLSDSGLQNVAATQSLGQMVEIVAIILMPFFFRKLGVKWMLLVGMLAWALRYALFAIAAPTQIFWMIVLGVAIHGVCYDFFFVTGQIYIDKKAHPGIRAQAQGMLVFFTYGVGMFIGAQLAGNMFNSFLDGGQTLAMADWATFWSILGGMAIVVAVFFGIVFRDRVEARDEEIPGAVPLAEPGL